MVGFFLFIYLFILILAVLGLCCSARAQYLPHGMWNLSSPTRIKPTSPALEGGSLTTGPPGKSLDVSIYMTILQRQNYGTGKLFTGCQGVGEGLTMNEYGGIF